MPADLAARVTREISIPTVGIGAGSETDGQILVWSDMAGLRTKVPKFVRQYADLESSLHEAATRFKNDVSSGEFPSKAESYD